MQQQFDLSFMSSMCCARQNGRLTTNQSRKRDLHSDGERRECLERRFSSVIGKAVLELLKIGLNGRQTCVILMCKLKEKLRDMGLQIL